MGSASELGYHHERGNALQRAVQAVAATAVGARTFAVLLPPLDGAVHRLSRGRTSLPAVLAGLPVIMVTTTGRRSGRPRTTPLIAVPVDDDLVVLGTNFGQPDTPAWVLNLETEPRARVEYRDRACEVSARPATDDERERAWTASRSVYGGYEKYRARVTDRHIRVFVLEPLAERGDGG